MGDGFDQEKAGVLREGFAEAARQDGATTGQVPALDVDGQMEFVNGGGGSQPSVLTVETDPNTFQAVVVLDFGAAFIGGLASIRITPTTFAGDGETFGGAGGDELFLNNQAGSIETSIDGVKWVVGAGTNGVLTAAFLDSNVGNSAQDVYALGDATIYIASSVRYLRWTMQLESDTFNGIYAGPNHPVLTTTLTVSPSAVLV